MNLSKTQQQSTSTSVASSSVKTHLSGISLFIARTVWLVLIIPSLCLTVVSFPAYYQQLQRACGDPTTCNVVGVMTAKGLRSLATLGFSVGEYAAFYTIFWVVIVVIWGGIGLLIFWRRSDDGMALLTAFFLVLFSTGPTTSALPITYPALALPVVLMGLLGQFSLAVFFLLFPSGRLVPRWMGLVIPLFIIQAVLFVAPPTSPLNGNNWPGWFNALLSLTIYGSIIVSQVYRYRRASTAVERQQTKWVTFAITIVVTGFFVFGLLFSTFFPAVDQPDSSYSLIQIAYPLLLLVLPVSVGIAILRYRLWDIDIIIKRTLVYGTLTLCIVGIYVLVVGYLGALFRTGANLLISLIATGLVAVLFQPLRAWLQRGVNRLLYGQRDEPYIVITRLSQRLEGALAPEAVLSTIVETVAQALRLPYAAILLKREDIFAEASSYGKPVSDPLTLPLTYQGETIGQLQLAPRAAGEVFTPADRRLLDELARQAGLAAHAVRLTADLQRSREHLVTAREEERRRLRRDLHDGLGATLAALHLQAGAIRTLMRQDVAAADAEILDLQAEIRSAVADIRRLVYALRPPTLDELGLVGAIRQYAAQYDTPNGLAGEPGMSLRVVVEAPEQLPALSAAVEVAAYRVVQEALTNVVRHAQACSCRICLSLPDDDDLQVEITDDGVGLPQEPRAGVGLLSMRERAEEVGGSCMIEPAPGRGTRVLARLPFPKDVPTADLSEANSSPPDDTKRSRDSSVGGLHRKD